VDIIEGVVELEVVERGVEDGVLTKELDPSFSPDLAQDEVPRIAIKLTFRKISRRILETRLQYPLLLMLGKKDLSVDSDIVFPKYSLIRLFS